MKILHVINSLAAGGAENLVVTIVNQQSISNETTLFTFNSEKDVFNTKLNKKVKFYPNKNSRFFSFRKLKQLYLLMLNHDIIHVHLFPPLYIVAFLSLFVRNKKIIFTEHNIYNNRRKKLFVILEKLVYSSYDHIICISKGSEDALKKWIGISVKTTVIKNVVNKEEIERSKPISRNDFNISNNDILICMVGSFQEQKDQDTMIEAMKHLSPKHKLLLIGAGERESILKKQVSLFGLTERINFLGVRGDVYSILKCCDYGVLSSHWEGFGIVALEYIFCGILSIGSNVAGLKEVIYVDDCLFDVGNHVELAKIISDFDDNPMKYYKVLNKQKEHAKIFNLENAINKHYRVYQN